MSDKWFFAITEDNREHLCRKVCEVIRTAPIGFVIRIMEAARSLDQNAKFHAIIGDIAKTCTFMDRKWDADDWKRLLCEAFVAEMRSIAQVEGQPDPFPGLGGVCPSLDGMRVVQLGVQTRDFKKKMASDFIEYLLAYGSNHGARWSDASRKVFSSQVKEFS